MFKLVISDDEGKQTIVPLVRDEITIGRKEGNTIRLTERNVSRRHARLVKANGKFVVEDLHSYNGVRVNGQRIGAETGLEPGDQIAIGDYQLALQMDGAETAVDRQAPGAAQVDTAMLASPGPPARLVMITPPAPGAEFALTQEKVRIGRAEDLAVWINHRSISREHAEIQKEPDGGFRLIDLGSANGVRVNGEDVQNALLTAGDVLELGQVRFRFVAAGEHYAFEADRTVQMDAVSMEPDLGGSRAPIMAAIAIVVIAVIGAVALAFWGGGGDETTVTPLDTPRIDGPDEQDPYQTALAACTTALRDDDIPRAVEQANAALAARPDDSAASACLARARALEAQMTTFNAGVRALDNGDPRAAWEAFMSLPEGSPLRRRDEVRRAARTLATFVITNGQNALSDGDYSDALASATEVLALPGITTPQRASAEQLRDDAQAGGGEEVEPAADVPEPASSGRRGGRRGRGRRGDSQSGGQTGGQTSSGQTGNTQSGGTQSGGTTTRPTNPRPTANVEAQARQLTSQGDNQGVIRLLEGGRARTPTSLALLIAAYRARGQTSRAVGHMRSFVQRYPAHARSQQYRQFLQRQ